MWLGSFKGRWGGSDFTHWGSGVDRATGAGLPRFPRATFTGAFPFARLDLEDPKVPLDVALEAYNPFIPGDPDDSGLPAALFTVRLHNRQPVPVRAVLYANLENRTGHPEVGNGRIEYWEGEGVQGLLMTTQRHAPDSPRYGELALVTPYAPIRVQTHWYRGGWFDELHRFWDQVAEDAFVEVREPAERSEGTDVGTIALSVTLEPEESIGLPVWMLWYNPIFEKYWDRVEPKPTWRNYYATRFESVTAVAEYLARHADRLEAKTRQFQEALFSSTLPESVLDAISANLSILKSPTCLRLEDGTFYAFEGCSPGAGCCEGTCTHVWNYAQALPYLFPQLERSVREADYKINLHEDGHMTFRMPLPLGVIPDASFHAAADGQLGGVMKVYREWQICGDTEWLRKLWPSVRRALEYAWKYWDPDQDGVMEGVQHNTYDIEFFGPNSMLGSFYLGALRAAEEMARALGEEEQAQTYRRIFESGRQKLDEMLFNGEYYTQQVQFDAWRLSPNPVEPRRDPVIPDYPVYQYGRGCLSDQLIGQWYARMLRLGDLLDPDHVRRAIASVFRYNWKPSLMDHANPQRIYALNDEAGLLLATWPHGERPGLPFVYSDEVWTGIEYQVASHLIYEGYLEEGLAIVKAVRDRHDGTRRNPWNEFECGHHYARALASYSLLLALADFWYSAPNETLTFAPRLWPEEFCCFFSVDSGWGRLHQRRQVGRSEVVVELLEGELRLKRIELGFSPGRLAVRLGGSEVSAAAEGQAVLFHGTVCVLAGAPLSVESWEE
ncbi:MAG: hypothetical protein KatS3mg115_1690 [Candidatus Poribacteria bacterium]|nr:MAG: hypothetical protein KatS3mg115_1690 [Candidatus Poribacteria bacterium]